MLCFARLGITMTLRNALYCPFPELDPTDPRYLWRYDIGKLFYIFKYFTFIPKLTEMKKIVIPLLLLCMSYANAQVGIGTTTPNNNAVLDMVSSNKAVLIPRVADTANIASPAEGMMIYNKNSKAPFFHNGNQWLSLGARLPSLQPTAGAVLKYYVNGPGFSMGENDATSAQVGAGFGASYSGNSVSSSSEFVFTKILDVNSKAFNLATLTSSGPYTIEFKFYAANSAVPYLSYQLKNAYFSGYAVSSGGDTPFESISVFYENYGFKDWVNNVEFGYNAKTHTVTTY
ncbi:MAG: hypothetical protein JWQ27_3201 [Ferruginibacter sp.]|nr:hypothetical protein [Ferruginibacter sp.]